MFARYVWVIFPIGLNFIWLVTGIFAGQLAWSHDGVACIMMAVFTSTLAGAGIFGFIIHDIGPGRAFVAMMCQTFVLIGIFAEIYASSLSIPFGDALYNSVVTWTSLGPAGDFMPAGSTKVVMAAQAITGYVYLGLLVSVLSGVVGQSRRRDQDRPANPTT